MNIKIGSLNCLNFGIASEKKGKGKIIAQVINNEKFDIIALQEIKSPGVVKDILFHLNTGIRKGSGKWQGCADTDARGSNDYAFIWNSDRITLPVTKAANGQTRIFQPHIYNQYPRDPELGRISFARPPFYGRFQTRFKGLPNFEVRLINTHIRYSKGKDGKELTPTTGEIELRKFEFKALTRSIYYRISDKIYGKSEGESVPATAYTILLGDYNLNLKESGAGYPCMNELEAIEIICNSDDGRTKLIVTKQAELTTLKKPNENEEEVLFANNYDHFSYDENRFSGTRSAIEKIDTVRKYFNSDPKKHLENFSDHTPIKMTLSIKKG
ncbi:MAG: hypothetical protein E7563_07190 [Ruminococcaceae bacterium]|nr:hypothetical protein [Oscillospiraceae bacterium]